MMKKTSNLMLSLTGFTMLLLGSCTKDKSSGIYLPSSVSVYYGESDSTVYSLVYDAEERIQQIIRSNAVFASFTYNDDNSVNSFTLTGYATFYAHYTDGHLSSITNDKNIAVPQVDYNNNTYFVDHSVFSFGADGDIENMIRGSAYVLHYSNSSGPFRNVNMHDEVLVFLGFYTDITYNLDFLSKKELTGVDESWQSVKNVYMINNIRDENDRITTAQYLNNDSGAVDESIHFNYSGSGK